jgi:hypothetical protein
MILLSPERLIAFPVLIRAGDPGIRQQAIVEHGQRTQLPPAIAP